jgi:hypothetical protein
MSPPFSGSKNRPNNKTALKQAASREELISQEIELFITTAVRF